MELVLSYLNTVLERERFEQFRDKMMELAPATEDVTMRYSEHMIEQGREQGLEQGREQGLEQGLEQGRAEGQRATLVKQLTLKFGPLDAGTLARVEASTPLELERALERILSASTLAAVLAP